VFNFLAVHAVQTSTEPLAQVLGQQNPEVVVFPNAVARLPLPVNFQSRERVTFFFAGLNRDSDWPPYVAALNAVIARTGDRIHFHIVNDRGLFDALATPAKTFTPLCDYETYLYHLGHSEISFMPLLDSDFNRCKSDLKFIEAAAHRVVALASPVVYESVIEDGVTGMIFRDEAELATKLLYLVNDIGACQRIAEAARAYVTRHRMLGAQLAERSAWYRSLWERRADLHASLLRRVPQLAVHHPNLARVEA
jgi:glycosyltransferase involved in cell wall biosynthesis